MPDRRPNIGAAIETSRAVETLTAIGSWRWDGAAVRVAD